MEVSASVAQVDEQDQVAKTLQEMSLNLDRMSAVSSPSPDRERHLLSARDSSDTLDDGILRSPETGKAG